MFQYYFYIYTKSAKSVSQSIDFFLYFFCIFQIILLPNIMFHPIITALDGEGRAGIRKSVSDTHTNRTFLLYMDEKIPDGIEKHVHLPSLWVIWERSLIPLSPHMRQQLAALDSVISFAFLQQASKSAPLTRRLFCTLPLATEKDVRHLSHLILLTNPATYSTWVQLL